MKKALFLAIATVVLASCGGNAPEGEAAKADSLAAAAKADSLAAAAVADSLAAAPAADTAAVATSTVK